MRLDPNTPPIGRAPAQVQIAPSKSYPWYGQMRGAVKTELAWVGGDRFTVQQEAALIKLGRDVPTAEAITVRRQADPGRELWVPRGQLPPVFAFDCPVIGHRADGRIKVIAPNGSTKFVLPDGWAHHPYRRPRDEYGYPL